MKKTFILLFLFFILFFNKKIYAACSGSVNHCYNDFSCVGGGIPGPYGVSSPTCQNNGNKCVNVACTAQSGNTCGWQLWVNSSCSDDGGAVGGSCRLGTGAPDGGFCAGTPGTPVPPTNTPRPAATNTPIPPTAIPPTAPPPPPPGCTTQPWQPGACRAGGCLNGYRQQIRTVSPAGCAATSQCVLDNTCLLPTNTPAVATNTPVPPTAAPPTNTPTRTPTPTPPAPTVDLKVGGSDGPVTVTSGNTVTTSWSTANVTSCTASASVATGNWSGAKAVNGSQSNVGSITSNRRLTISCTGPGGTATDFVDLNIPPSVDLKVNSGDGPVSVSSGATISISWTSSDTTSCTASASTATGNWNGAVAVNGTVGNGGPVNSSRTIQISCTGPGGTASDNVQVNVSAAVPTVTLTVNGSGGPISVASGSNVTTVWSSSNATSCTASASTATGNWNGALGATSGTQNNVGTITSGRTLIVTCTGPGGSASDSVQVNLTAGPVAPTVDLQVNSSNGPVTVSPGSTVTTTWTSSNATSCTASGSVATGNWNGALGATSGTQNNVGPITASQTVTLTCTGPGGSSSDVVQLNVAAVSPPTVNLLVNGSNGPVSVSSGTNVTTSWTSSNATSCTAFASSLTGNWNGSVATSGNVAAVGPINSSRSVSITCTGPGGSTTDSVQVNLTAGPVAPTVNLLVNGSSGPVSIPSGSNVSAVWTSVNATTCTASGSTSTTNWNGALPAANGTQNGVGPINSNRTLFVTCTGPGGSTSDSVDIQMAGAGPTVNLFVNGTGGSVSVPQNATVIVTWTSTNTTSCTAGATTATGNWNGNVAANGTQANVGPIATSRTLGIQCTGPGGTTTDTVDLTTTVASALPVVTLLVNGVPGPLAVPLGTLVSTSWTSSNATSCTASAAPAMGNWSGAKAVNGSQNNTVGPMGAANTTVVLSCTGPGGTSNAAVDLISTAPPVCEIPMPRDPPDTACAAPPTNTGSITWKWTTVANANQYELTIIDTTTGAPPVGCPSCVATWRSAAAYGCAVGTDCSFTTTGLSPKSYQSRLRAGSTVNTCTAPTTTAVSQTQNILVCPGIVQARAVRVSPSDTSCSAVASGTGISSSVTLQSSSIGFSDTKASSGAPVTWNTLTPATYTVSMVPQPEYILQTACWTRDINSPLSGTGQTLGVGSTETVSWGLGYTLGKPWSRGKDGEMTICTDVSQTIPILATPNAFVANSTGVNPGIVSYGNCYDFDGSGSCTGGSGNVSSTDWLAHEAVPSICATDWYQYFVNKMDVASMTTTAVPNPVTPALFAGLTDPIIKVVGSLNTQGNWNVNKSTVIFVAGDVKINGNINIVGNSFFAIIASGNITIDSSVGTRWNDATPNLQGLYITGPTGRFITGQSTSPSKEKLVVKGTVIAGGFTLQRDLDSQSHNQDTPAEEFIYDPGLLLSMPDSFKDLRIKWEEVAP